ncbi:hypothetical protein T484DRAFT_1772901 [Baffinella frigidus]|nr:hypothetical protein T484DRAFT_1772901 [Cryptophyta sp. CCMP2293]
MYADGSVYVGQIEKGQRHGLGVYCFTNGTSYAGEWHLGLEFGSGVEARTLPGEGLERGADAVLVNYSWKTALGKVAP